MWNIFVQYYELLYRMICKLLKETMSDNVETYIIIRVNLRPNIVNM